MFWWGKLLGCIFGYWIAGIWGALLGCWAGHQFDLALAKASGETLWGEKLIQRAFFEATFSIMGFLAKADGRVSEKAILEARQVMQQMSLSPKQKREAMDLFRQGKQLDYNLDASLYKLLRLGDESTAFLQQFIELQLKVVYNSDGYLSSNKQQLLDYIAGRLGFMLFDATYYGYTDNPHSGRANSKNNLFLAYEILGISNAASNQEVKKAYRRLMSRYHPDKIISLGKASLLQTATEKTQKIKEAYEQIKEARGMV